MGATKLNCTNGELNGPIPTCEGLNQLYNYAMVRYLSIHTSRIITKLTKRGEG